MIKILVKILPIDIAFYITLIYYQWKQDLTNSMGSDVCLTMTIDGMVFDR